MALRRPQLPNLGPRTRKVLRIVGYVVLALVTFVFAFQLTFPFERVKARIEEALAEKYTVNITEVERGWIPGRIYLNSVSLITKTTKPDETPTTIYIDRLEVDVGLLALIGGKASVDIDAKIGNGHISGNVSISKGATSIDLEGSNLQSAMLPMRETIGLPMSGMVEFAFTLDLPNEEQKPAGPGQKPKLAPNWQKAEGGADLSCPAGCTFGDGKTKLKTKLKNARNQAFAEGGIDFGKVNLNSLVARVDIKGGQLNLSKFDAKSDDGTLFVDYAMELQPVFGESNVTGCLRFNGSQALLKREPKTFTAISATGAQLGPDNLFHIRLTDKFKDMKRLAQPCGSAVAGKSMDNPSGPSRPNLTVQPDEPARIDPGAIPQFNPPPPLAPDGGVGGGSGPSTGDAAVGLPMPGPDHPGSAAGPGHGSGDTGHVPAQPPPPPGAAGPAARGSPGDSTGAEPGR